MLQEVDLWCLGPGISILRAPGARVTFPQVTTTGDGQGKLVFSVATHTVASTPTIGLLERHPHSTQSFIALSAKRWILAVAPDGPDGRPDTGNIVYAVLGQGDAVCIEKSVWHAPILALESGAELAMQMWRTESGEDTELFELPKKLVLELDQ